MEEFISLYDLTDEEIDELYSIYEYDLYVNNSAGFVDEIQLEVKITIRIQALMVIFVYEKLGLAYNDAAFGRVVLPSISSLESCSCQSE